MGKQASFAIVVVIASSVHADIGPYPKLEDVIDMIDAVELEAPKLVITDTEIEHKPSAGSMFDGRPVAFERRVIAYSANKNVAWVAADLRAYQRCVNYEDLGPDVMGDPIICEPNRKKDGTNISKRIRHGTGLFERTKTTWRPIVWHTGSPISSKDQAKAIKAKTELVALPRKITGAEEIVKLFEKTLADPKAFIASVSDRADVVLYGTEEKERYVGAQVKQTLGTWKLTMKLRDGVVAGTVGTAAYVVANVDASNAAVKNVPYRLLAIYEQAGGAWKIVQLNFSYPNSFEDFGPR